MRLLMVVAAWFAVAVGSALAQAPAPDCGGSQQAMNACAAATLGAEDEALNQRFQQALAAQYDDQGREMLRAAQRTWLAYRDAKCAHAGDEARGGSLSTLLVLTCMEQMTRQRVVELGIAAGERGGGLDAGIMLARLRQMLPKPLRSGVFWLPEGVLSADYDQSGATDVMAVGLRPADIRGEGGMVYVAALPAGAGAPLVAEVPIGEGGMCAAPAEVRLEFQDGGGAVIAVDDGACDAFRFGLTSRDGQPHLVLHRN